MVSNYQALCRQPMLMATILAKDTTLSSQHAQEQQWQQRQQQCIRQQQPLCCYACRLALHGPAELRMDSAADTDLGFFQVLRMCQMHSHMLMFMHHPAGLTVSDCASSRPAVSVSLMHSLT